MRCVALMTSRRGGVVLPEPGRAPFDSKYSAARHASFESSAAIERGLAAALRHLLRPVSRRFTAVKIRIATEEASQ